MKGGKVEHKSVLEDENLVFDGEGEGEGQEFYEKLEEALIQIEDKEDVDALNKAEMEIKEEFEFVQTDEGVTASKATQPQEPKTTRVYLFIYIYL